MKDEAFLKIYWKILKSGGITSGGKYSKLNNNEIIIYSYLLGLQRSGLVVHPSFNTISKWCNVGRSTTNRSLDKLVKEGLVEKTTKGNSSGDANTYFVKEPDKVSKSREISPYRQCQNEPRG